MTASPLIALYHPVLFRHSITCRAGVGYSLPIVQVAQVVCEVGSAVPVLALRNSLTKSCWGRQLLQIRSSFLFLVFPVCFVYSQSGQRIKDLRG